MLEEKAESMPSAVAWDDCCRTAIRELSILATSSMNWALKVSVSCCMAGATLRITPEEAVQMCTSASN